ncbi:flagellin [Enterovibrio calviensis]|uniref:flagellin n=1 Tax=Enterovibrio calviensis TaxID=91359 RepID=UPI00373529FF
MAMSTVEVRPHGIRLTGHEQASITPSRSPDQGSIQPQQYPNTKADTTSAYSVSTMRLAQGQQHATSVQIASKSLQQVGKELSKMKSGLTQAMTHGVQNTPTLKDTLAQSKKSIENTLQQARFDGKRVVDNELRVKLASADIRRFSIPGLNVNRLSERAEQIRLDFPQGQSVMIPFDGVSDGNKTIKILDRSLIPMGMRASLANDGSILFEAQESAYSQMQQKVMVTGQGYRFPAGQPNTLTLKPDPEGIAELSFDLSGRDGIKKTIARVNQHIRQVHAGLEDARTFHNELSTQMNALRQQEPAIKIDDVNQKLAQLHASSGQFTKTFEALNAQANVKRHSVVALLK